MNVAKHWHVAGEVFAISDCLVVYIELAGIFISLDLEEVFLIWSLHSKPALALGYIIDVWIIFGRSVFTLIPTVHLFPISVVLSMNPASISVRCRAGMFIIRFIHFHDFCMLFQQLYIFFDNWWRMINIVVNNERSSVLIPWIYIKAWYNLYSYIAYGRIILCQHNISC